MKPIRLQFSAHTGADEASYDSQDSATALESTPEADARVENLRQWTRFPCEGRELVIIPEGKPAQIALVLDESYGGIGILFTDAENIQVGMEVQVVDDGGSSIGIVRYIRAADSLGFHGGLEW